MPEPAPVSAARLAELLGDRLPPAASVPPEAFGLVAAARDLVEAIVMTDVDAAARAAATAEITAVTRRLRTARRPQPLYLVRHPDGRVESLVQAGSGRLNPQAPPVEWVVRPTEPPPGREPEPVEVTARCTFTAAHGGSPGRVYGGVLALVLDEVLGVAVRAAGANGMTVSLSTSLRGPTPIGEPVEITARLTHLEGRKCFATGEVRTRAGTATTGTVTAEASAIFVGQRTEDDRA
jgi:acyl-coenzyme A thioesterase PaaI-like protein